MPDLAASIDEVIARLDRTLDAKDTHPVDVCRIWDNIQRPNPDQRRGGWTGSVRCIPCRGIGWIRPASAESDNACPTRGRHIRRWPA
jgi:hypothetical protein